MTWTRGRRAAAIAVLAVIGLYGNNTTACRPPSGRAPTLLAHRGLAQEYDRAGLTGETCTAARMLPPHHRYLENTIPSIAAAFAAGADVVEVDVHPTTDGEFAVFHDWTLDCRTDGHGVTREHTLAELRALDVGYGYTADGGATFPFRGEGIGLLPSLREVLRAFPERQFMINVKGGEGAEGDRLADYLAGEQAERLVFSGGEAPMAALRRRLDRPTLTRRGSARCMLAYMGVGWTGHVPAVCARSVVYVPINFAPLFWGWPGVFFDRMRAAEADVYAIGPYWGGYSDGLDEPADLARLPADYDGGVSTDRIDEVAAAFR